jgi:hypothetical protein
MYKAMNKVLLLVLKNVQLWFGLVVYACNSSFLEIGDQKDYGSRSGKNKMNSDLNQ